MAGKMSQREKEAIHLKIVKYRQIIKETFHKVAEICLENPNKVPEFLVRMAKLETNYCLCEKEQETLECCINLDLLEEYESDVTVFDQLEDKYLETQAILKMLNLTVEPISPPVT